jgi:uncharacterized protein (TIGR00730 family)
MQDVPALSSVCVFCGSNGGADPAYLKAAADVGRTLAERGLRLVYGGAHVGMMGVLANAAMEAGGAVTGVIPRQIVDLEVANDDVRDLRIVDSMHERKALMADLAGAFVALPGGIGTLEELFEVFTWAHLGLHRKPLGLLDVLDYYRPLETMLDHAVEQGFLRPETRAMLVRDDSLGRLLERFADWQPAPGARWIDRAGS